MNIDMHNPDINLLSENPQNYQGLCPDGWHSPNQHEWETLVKTAISLYKTDMGFEGKLFKSVVPGNALWNSPQYNAWNPIGFSILPAGLRGMDGTWRQRDSTALFWSAGRGGPNNWIYGRYTHYAYPAFDAFSMDEVSGFASLRCLANSNAIISK